MIAPLRYDSTTRRLIHDLKYHEKLHVADALVQHYADCYQSQNIDAIIPVPLHRDRLLERGYNQSLEIAQAMSRHLHIGVDNNSLKRIKATGSQAGLSLNQRQRNIRKAFQYSSRKNYRSVAIVDDIITSGSTVNEISKVLQGSGIEHIQVWGLARALKHD